MAKLSKALKSPDDRHLPSVAERFMRRVEATPPGDCPLTMQLALLQTGMTQTCGKCVPCRDGLPQLATILARIVSCRPLPGDLERLRNLAEMIRATSDCAIGYEAAQACLDGLEDFAEEYEHHINKGSCQHGVGQTLPCETMCPAHVNVPGYITLVEVGRYADAVNMVRKDNPFPTACAFVCEHPCEERCRRILLDAPLNIRGIKKYAVDHAPVDKVPNLPGSVNTDRHIAVVGGGPSGLTCAHFLARMGHSVTVFEARAQLGGMMRYGIPAYRFPRERLDEDIRGLLDVGNITVRYKEAIDGARMKELVQDFDAVYVSIGAQAGKKLAIEGIDAKGVYSAVDLLGAIGDDDYPDFSGKRAIVVGGGNVAMDCARTAVRAGADEVTVVYRRRKEDMTALPAEVEAAVAEGVEMATLLAPDAIKVDDEGNCCGLYVQPQMIGPVKRGRPAPLSADKPQEFIEAEIILIAVGQDVVSQPFEEFGMQTTRGCFVSDDALCAMGFNNVFVGGDCQTGPSTVINAIGAGKVAARNIDEYLGYHHTLICDIDVPEPVANNRIPTGRVEIEERRARERRKDFLAVEGGMSEEEVLQECRRCLRCDHFGCGALDEGRVLYA